jgi:DNA-binding GntR family transcriptional regulator
MLLEGPIVEKVVKNKRADIPLLRSINDDAEAAAGDLVKVLEHHHRFHNALLEMAGNMTLALLAKMIDLVLDEADLRRSHRRRPNGLTSSWSS